MESHKEPSFEVKKSPVSEAYALFSAENPFDLQRKYSEADQILMKSHAWDYENGDLIINKVKDIIESVVLENIHDPEEYKWCKEILWFWYHHAISCAIWRYKDKEKATLVSARALELQGDNHPNKITRLLYLLVRDRVAEAEELEKNIIVDYEQETASTLIHGYKKGEFF